MKNHWDKVISDSELVCLPQVYLKLQQVLYRDEFSLTEIVDVISLDPAITARLLRMVNSSFFGLAARIETVTHAVNYLGAQQVHDLVLTASIARTFSDLNSPEFDLKRFWNRSVYNAIAARDLATFCNLIDGERLFVSGLLSHIGDLMMFQSIPELTQQALVQSQQSARPLHLCQRDLVGFDYAAVAAELLKNWHLPESLTEAIRYQLEPGDCKSFALEASILHIAGHLGLAFEQAIPIDTIVSELDHQALKLSGLTADQLIVIHTQVRKNLDSVRRMLFPQY